MATVLSDKQVVIRKEHSCFGCFRKFPVGTKMHYSTCVYDGDLCSTYCCETCRSLMKFIDMEDGVFPEGFVGNDLNKGQTPEQLLEEYQKLKTND